MKPTLWKLDYLKSDLQKVCILNGWITAHPCTPFCARQKPSNQISCWPHQIKEVFEFLCNILLKLKSFLLQKGFKLGRIIWLAKSIWKLFSIVSILSIEMKQIFWSVFCMYFLMKRTSTRFVKLFVLMMPQNETPILSSLRFNF